VRTVLRAILARLTDDAIAAHRDRAGVTVEELDAALEKLRELRGDETSSTGTVEL
jgi:DNA-binding GntR family transcriptional regulator